MKKKLHLVSIIIAASAIIFGLWQINEISKINDTLDAELIAREKAEKINASLYELIVADGDVMINSELKRAQSVFEKKLDELPDSIKPIILERINLVRQLQYEIQSAPNTGKDENELLRSRQIISMLKKENDSLISHSIETSNLLKTENEKLKSENAKLENALAKKDRLTVISFVSPKGEKVQYLGEIAGGKAQGGGVGIWPTGSIYRGEWVNNQRHGKGKFEWADGEIYEGNFVHDRREGKGTYKWPSGERYEGEWLNNQRHGYGILYDMDGNERYRGQWKHDVPVVK